MTTSRMSRVFCDTLPPRGFEMRHFALAEKVLLRVTTKARVLIATMEPPLSGSTIHLCGGLRTMISQSNSRATAVGRAPNQHVGDRRHPTGLNRLLCMRTGPADLPAGESRLPQPPQTHRQLARHGYGGNRAVLFHRQADVLPPPLRLPAHRYVRR